jgi:mRNA-degrading endonuclease toxin of MazEF toxin-antitoxin module
VLQLDVDHALQSRSRPERTTSTIAAPCAPPVRAAARSKTSATGGRSARVSSRRTYADEGSVANCDNVLTIPKTALARHRGTLGPAELRTLDDALRISLALD